MSNATPKQQLLHDLLHCNNEIFGIVIGIRDRIGQVIDVETLLLQTAIINTVKRKHDYLSIKLNDDGRYNHGGAIVLHWFGCDYKSIGNYCQKTLNEVLKRNVK